MLSTCNFVIIVLEHLCDVANASRVASARISYLLLAGVELGLVLQSQAELRMAVDGVDIRWEESGGEISVAVPISPPEATARNRT